MIHIDFTLEQRDLFRVNLELIKVRLLIAGGFAMVAMIGLMWFFYLIDEMFIYLQLTPLFLSLPIIAVGGQILRLHAICRRFVQSQPESQRRVQYLFQESADGYDVTWGGSFSHIHWQDLMLVVEKKQHFLFYFNKMDIRVLPKAGFHQPSDIPLFRQVVGLQIGTRAKLLTSEVN
jgi:YcxB-like protein